MENEAENLIRNLTKILVNLKKSPNRRFLKQTLLSKQTEARDLYETIITKLENYEENKQKALSRDTRNIYGEIKTFLDIRLDVGRFLPKFKTLAQSVFVLRKLHKQFQKMAFDFKTATSLVQPYDGSPGGLDSFLDASILLQEITVPAHAEVAAKFLKTRLTGKARIGLSEQANTIAQIIEDVKTRCQDKTTAESIIAKLKTVKFKNSSQSYCTEIEDLSIQLKNVYIANKIPVDVATKMSTKSGVDALINGISNQEVKLILKAGTFTDLKDAIQKVNENVSDSSNGVQILSFSGRHNHFRKNNRYSYNNNGRINNFSNNRNPNGQRNNNNGSNRVYPRTNYNNFSQHRFSQSQNFGNSRGRGRNNHARNVYLADVNGNMNPISQHGAVDRPSDTVNHQQVGFNPNFLDHMDQLPQINHRPYTQ